METKNLSAVQLKRVNPFRGLIIDPDTWATAHGYHLEAARLHRLLHHRPGIVCGLEVRATDPPSESVLIEPGVGVDSAGNMMVLGSRQTYRVQADSGLVYLIIQYREIPTDRVPVAGGSETAGAEGNPTRIVEGFRIQERREPPPEAHLELARVEVSGKAIANAADPFRPRSGEIDLRCRLETDTTSPAEIAVGYLIHPGDPEGVHLEGVCRMVRSAGPAFACRFLGRLSLRDKNLQRCDILYLSGGGGFELEGSDILPAFFRHGGVMMGEPCQGVKGDANSFKQAFHALAVGSKLAPVGFGHELLTRPHLFSAPPEGAAEKTALWASGGLIFSECDYGCAWRGGTEKRPLSRSVIRDATELAANLMAYAYGVRLTAKTQTG
jgi:hypothetical protein